MSMLDSFFNKGFKAAKCKTLLKLTIPRIKLLRNRREIQLKQMRRDIAKLLETGQEATARIRVEHIVREENMMAAQEIIELFCELIAVRLPIIESQRECPLDLKEAISSVCFAAPRCADLPELLQVQLLFASKYGKEFVSAATELVPDCGVNRQLIELLSVRAPPPEKKLNLLKEIAEEHELDWSPDASESELLKPHEDLLNGPSQFISGSKLPLPKEKHDETLNIVSEQVDEEHPDSDDDLDTLDLPSVPTERPSASVPPLPVFPQTGNELDSLNSPSAPENLSQESHFKPEEIMQERSVASEDDFPNVPIGVSEDKQFLPFISAPSLTSSFTKRQSDPRPPPISRTRNDANVDLQDVLAAAQNAAESAERAAAAARSAASLAQIRINEITKRKYNEAPEDSCENPFHEDTPDQFESKETSNTGNSSSFLNTLEPLQDLKISQGSEDSNLTSLETHKVKSDSSVHIDHALEHDSVHHLPQRLPSMDDDSYFSYPNLFTSQIPNLGSGTHSFTDNSHSANNH